MGLRSVPFRPGCSGATPHHEEVRDRGAVVVVVVVCCIGVSVFLSFLLSAKNTVHGIACPICQMIESPLGLCCCASACAAGNTEVAGGIDGNTWVVVGIAGDIGFVVLAVVVVVVVVVLLTAAVEALTV